LLRYPVSGIYKAETTALTLPAVITFNSMKDEQDLTHRLLVISTDISELKKAENELIKKNQCLSFAEKITMMVMAMDIPTKQGSSGLPTYTIFGVEENTPSPMIRIFYLCSP